MSLLYDLPNWLFGLFIVLAANLIGITGLYATRGFVRRQHGLHHSHNDIVSYFCAAVTVFYGITLGLLAVSAWTNYTQVQARVDTEAEVISSLYRDTGGYPEPTRTDLRGDLREYTKRVIDVTWPAQRKGTVPGHATEGLDKFQDTLTQFQPTTPAQQIIQAEVFHKFDDLVEARRARISSVHSKMPQSLWTLVFLGALLTIGVTLFFDTASFRMHLWMTLCLATLLGLMIFLIGTLDNPFRGSGGVSSAPLDLVYREITR
jgi:hypothetical protein